MMLLSREEIREMNLEESQMRRTYSEDGTIYLSSLKIWLEPRTTKWTKSIWALMNWFLHWKMLKLPSNLRQIHHLIMMKESISKKNSSRNTTLRFSKKVKRSLLLSNVPLHKISLIHVIFLKELKKEVRFNTLSKEWRTWRLKQNQIWRLPK